MKQFCKSILLFEFENSNTKSELSNIAWAKL